MGLTAVPGPSGQGSQGGVWGWRTEMPRQCLFPGSVVGGFWAEKHVTEEEDALSRFIPCWFSS